MNRVIVIRSQAPHTKTQNAVFQKILGLKLLVKWHET